MNNTIHLAKQIIKQAMLDAVHAHQSRLQAFMLVHEAVDSGLSESFADDLIEELKDEDRLQCVYIKAYCNVTGGNYYVIESSSYWVEEMK